MQALLRMLAAVCRADPRLHAWAFGLLCDINHISEIVSDQVSKHEVGCQVWMQMASAYCSLTAAERTEGRSAFLCGLSKVRSAWT